MAPVVQGVADQLWKGLGPSLEFLPVRSVAGDIFFINAVGTHLTPFVVVASQPYLSDILKFAVLTDFLGINMAVIVQDRHGLSIVVIKLLSHFGR